MKAESDRVSPDFEYVHRELARPSVTLLLLWNEYVANCRASGGVPYRYSFFNERYRRWVTSTGASMHIQRSPGESVEVDWAGDAMSFADPVSGEAIDAWLFVAAFSFSAYVYVEAFTDMRLPAWIDAHVHTFEAFGGAGRLLVPDNLRTGVSRSDRYEAGAESGVRAPGRALRHRDRAGEGQAAPRQAGRGGQCPVRRQPGRRCATQPALRRVGRVERGDLRTRSPRSTPDRSRSGRTPDRSSSSATSARCLPRCRRSGSSWQTCARRRSARTTTFSWIGISTPCRRR